MQDISVIKTEHLTKELGAIRIIDDVNISVPPNSIYGLLGPNGAGKTTIIRILLGLIRPSHGSVRIFNKELQAARKEILAQIGALVETPSLYPHLTGRENLLVTTTLLGIDANKINDVLEAVDLQYAADRKVEQYSLGMKQRLGLALALINDPKLLILDEPTNGLDPAGVRNTRNFIMKLPEQFGITVMLSSHLLHEVEQVATQIGILNKGKLVFQGDLSTLKETYKTKRLEDAFMNLTDGS
ncbi:MAG: ATP-binding cassette domain-containing protein [Thermoproteota archaeon]